MPGAGGAGGPSRAVNQGGCRGKSRWWETQTTPAGPSAGALPAVAPLEKVRDELFHRQWAEAGMRARARSGCATRRSRAQTAMGGGTAGGAAVPAADSSKRAMRSITSTGSRPSTGGGGSAAPAAHHCATMPPQASIARRLTAAGSSRSGRTCCSDSGREAWAPASSASSESGGTLSRASAQHSGLAGGGATPSAVQQAGPTLQQEGFMFATEGCAGTAVAASRWTRCSSATTTAGANRWARAQASRWAGVWQQQLAKHCSAVAQPHALSMQGNGCERSLPERRCSICRCAAAPPGEGAAAGQRATGSGTPDAISA